jgi:hypothetical protein
MRKFAWLVPAVMLAFGGAAFAQNAPKKAKAAKVAKGEKAAKPAKAKPAKLVADPVEVDMGELKAGEEKEVSIKIKNEGEAEAKKVVCKGKGFKFEGDPAAIAGGADHEFKGKFLAPKKAGKKDAAKKGSFKCGKVTVKFKYTLKAVEAPAK